MENKLSVIELTQVDLDALEIPISQNKNPKINEQAFIGILKEFVEIAARNSEASKAAIAINVISFFSAIVGRRVFQWIGDIKIHCRPFFLLVGNSSKARKGTSEYLPRRVFKRVDEILTSRILLHKTLNIHTGGLSSGEGIAYAIRDSSDDGKDIGIDDKRLLVIEPEFAGVLANCRRESSTLSAVIRNCFDGRDLAPLTKTNRTRATDPHVVIVAHITSHELIERLSAVDINNGLINRFLTFFIAREKLVPLPEKTPQKDIDYLANKIVDILEFVDDLFLGGIEQEIFMNDNAKIFWSKIYSTLSADVFGNVGIILARTEVYTRMLAMIFALFEKKVIIEVSHIRAAVCLIDYFHESVKFIFQQKHEAEIDNLANKILMLLQEQKQMTRTEISNALNGHKLASEIEKALSHLLNQAPSRISQIKQSGTGGRAKIIYQLSEIS